MKIEDLSYNKKESEILSKPIPFDFDKMGYFARLRYAKSIYQKQKIIKDRCLNCKKEEFDREICVNTPGMDMEYFRCIDLNLMKQWIETNRDRTLQINVTGKVNCVFVRVGNQMQELLNQYNVQLKIVNIDGRVDIVNPIKSTQIYYFKLERNKE